MGFAIPVFNVPDSSRKIIKRIKNFESTPPVVNHLWGLGLLEVLCGDKALSQE
jgi:hypothetical protein